jgi:hypothetical protein
MVDAPRRHIRYATFLDTESHHFISTVLVIRILFIEGDTARREYCQYFCWKDVGRILRTFKIKKNVEVTDNGKIII